MTHFLLQGASSPTEPTLLFHVRIDVRDIRSGCSRSQEVYFRAEWDPEIPLLEGDLSWTPDMVTRVPRDRLLEIAPPRIVRIPSQADEWIRRFLERYYILRIWQHRELETFSEPSETLEDFIQRCRDLLQMQRSEKMRKVSEIMYHRFFQLHRRAIGAAQEDDVPDQMAARMRSELDEVFASGRGDLSRLFLRDDASQKREIGEGWRVDFLPQIQERLDDFRIRLLTRYNAVVSEFEERACRVDSFQLPITRNSVDILSQSIVWD